MTPINLLKAQEEVTTIRVLRELLADRGNIPPNLQEQIEAKIEKTKNLLRFTEKHLFCSDISDDIDDVLDRW